MAVGSAHASQVLAPLIPFPSQSVNILPSVFKGNPILWFPSH